MRASDSLLLTGLLAILLVWPLRAPPIATHGEAREGLVVQDVVRHGRWILPRRNDALPSKPPLFHWIAAATASAVGLSDAVVRFPSTLAAVGMALATLGLGVAAGGRTTGWLAAGALLGMHDFWESAAAARVDMVFATCVTLALAAFFRWYVHGGAAARAACYGAAAAAVLAKGPVGAVLPALVIVAFLAGRRELGRLRALWSWPLAIAAAVVDAGWYCLALRAGGWELVEVQVLHENLDRFAGRGVFGRHGGRRPTALVEELATDLLPWSLVLVWAGWRWMRGAREDAAGRLLHCWWLVVLGVFTLAFGKRGVYLLPLHPAIAVLAGRALAGALAPGAALAARAARWPAPGVLARVAPAWRATALACVAIAVLDVTLLLVAQGVRVHRAGSRSLAPFGAEVARLVPPGASLEAGPTLPESDLLVLAYRLARSIPRAAPGAPPAAGVYRLVPAEAARGLAREGYRRLAVSRRRRANVALLGPPVPERAAGISALTGAGGLS